MLPAGPCAVRQAYIAHLGLEAYGVQSRQREDSMRVLRACRLILEMSESKKLYDFILDIKGYYPYDFEATPFNNSFF